LYIEAKKNKLKQGCWERLLLHTLSSTDCLIQAPLARRSEGRESITFILSSDCMVPCTLRTKQQRN
jgi:hypothetical protein